jgi:predicted transcriptional regulator
MADGRKRTFKKEVRTKVYELVSSAPGITLPQIQQRLDISSTEAEHHINELINKDLLTVRIQGGQARYHAKGKKKRSDEKEDFELEARAKVFEIISQAPGLHLREIQKRLKIPLGTVEYHLKYFEDNDIVIVREEGGYKRYYPKKAMGSEDRKFLSLLRQQIPRRVVLFLMRNPKSSFGEIAKDLGLPPSSLSFHVKKLVKAEVIERTKKGRVSYFHVNDPDRVAKVLIAHRRSFLDELVDRFVSTWTEYHP